MKKINIILLLLLLSITLYAEQAEICTYFKYEYDRENKKTTEVKLESDVSYLFTNLDGSGQGLTKPKEYNPSWLNDVAWVEWKDYDDFNNTHDNGGMGTQIIALGSHAIHGKNLVLTIGGAGYRGYVYRVFLLSDIELAQFIKLAEKADPITFFDFDVSKFRKIFPLVSYSSNDFAWCFRNIFLFNGNTYLIGGSDFNNTIYNIIEITQSSEKVLCTYGI